MCGPKRNCISEYSEAELTCLKQEAKQRTAFLQKQWKNKHKEYYSKQRADQYQLNKYKLSKKSSEYYAKNKDKIKSRKSQYYIKTSTSPTSTSIFRQVFLKRRVHEIWSCVKPGLHHLL